MSDNDLPSPADQIAALVLEHPIMHAVLRLLAEKYKGEMSLTLASSPIDDPALPFAEVNDIIVQARDGEDLYLVKSDGRLIDFQADELPDWAMEAFPEGEQ